MQDADYSVTDKLQVLFKITDGGVKCCSGKLAKGQDASMHCSRKALQQLLDRLPDLLQGYHTRYHIRHCKKGRG